MVRYLCLYRVVVSLYTGVVTSELFLEKQSPFHPIYAGCYRLQVIVFCGTLFLYGSRMSDFSLYTAAIAGDWIRNLAFSLYTSRIRQAS